MMKTPLLEITLTGLLASALTGKMSAADFPQAEITNGQIRLKLYLPDARHGYYRGTRFDWSGVIASLEYKGHNYYGPWFDRMDPQTHDFGYSGREVLAGPSTAISGPVEEFQTNKSALGFDEARVGGTFVKIGIGVLRKDAATYDFVKLYEIVDPGKWAVKRNSDSVEFTQELTEPASGYGYVYRKTVRLAKGMPEMVLEHILKNTGRRAIQSNVYNHNFLVLDQQPPGPDFLIAFPFQLHSPKPADADLVQIRGNQIVFTKALENQEVVFMPLQGFADSPKDHEIRIENIKVRAGMKIHGDRPLSAVNFWAMRRVLSVEPFVTMAIEPGGEFAWKTTYEFYTLPASPR
jgi:hypothetical protein